MNGPERDGLQKIMDNAIADMTRKFGDSFDSERIDLVELSRRTGISGLRVRTLKSEGSGPAARKERQEGSVDCDERVRGRGRRPAGRKAPPIPKRFRRI